MYTIVLKHNIPYQKKNDKVYFKVNFIDITTLQI